MPADRNALQQLDALLARWAVEPTEALADAIVAAPITAIPGVRGKTKAAIAAWDAARRRATAAERPALYAAFGDVIAAAAPARMAAWPPDPRFDRALVALVEACPYHATSTKPAWTAIFAHLRGARAVDRRLLARLAAAATVIAQQFAPTMRTWLERELTRTLEILAVRPKLPPGEPIAIEPAPATRSLTELWAAVHEAPDLDDDAPRTVLADALLEAGDPRGDFIAQQLRGQYAKALVVVHGKTWLGELATLVARDFKFARGFLDSCEIPMAKEDRIAGVVGAPIWSTVRRFSGPAAIALHPIMRALRAYEFTSHDRSLGHPAWRDFLVGAPRPWTELHYHGPYEHPSDEHAALCRCDALPALRTLYLYTALPISLQLADAPIAARLHTFGLGFDGGENAAAVPALAPLFERARTPRLVLHINHSSFHSTIVELAYGLGPGGNERRYERATIEVGPTTRSPSWSPVLAAETLALLAALPELRSVDLHARQNLEAEDKRRLEDAIRARGLDD